MPACFPNSPSICFPNPLPACLRAWWLFCFDFFSFHESFLISLLHSGEFMSYFRHVKALGFYEQPNYSYLKKLFVALYERKYGGKFEDARFVYT